MKTKARVILMRKSTGMVAAETSAGSVTVFELLGCEMVKSGDILSGYMEELDNQEIYNETRDEELRVFIHERGLGVHEAIEKHFAQLLPSQRPRRPMWPARDRAPSR
jgi:hypothetical protein